MSNESPIKQNWHAYKKQRAAKKFRNKETSTFMLKHAGVVFESKNNGSHLVIENRIDFWPGTGLWIERNTGTRRRGITHLLATLEAKGE